MPQVKYTKDFDFVQAYLYAIEGAGLIIFNVPLVFFLLFSKNTRGLTQYRILAGCSIFNSIFGLTYLTAGVYRLNLAYTHEVVPFASPHECMMKPHLWLYLIVTPGGGLITLITSLDRAISVVFPLKYMKHPPYYPPILFTIAYVLVIPTFVISIFDAKDKNEITVDLICNLNMAVSNEIFQALRWIRVTTTLTAVAIYVPIAYRMKKIITNIYSSQTSRQEAKRLRQMALTVGLITLSQLLLFAVPDLLLLFFASTVSGISNILYVLNLNKGVFDAVVFIVTQSEIRRTMLPKLFPPSSVLAVTMIRHSSRGTPLFTITHSKKNTTYSKSAPKVKT